MSNLGFVEKHENHFDQSRAHYREALTLCRQLLQTNSKYAGDVARLEVNLEELDAKARK